jgi:ferredoxin
MLNFIWYGGGFVEKATIYYFSGTGNSLAVARDIAGKIDARLVSIPSVMEQESISFEADVVGIVFPAYHVVYDGLPFIIERFMDKIKNLEGKYIFAVCTCGGVARLTVKKLRDIIRARGGKLACGFSVTLPDNTNPTTKEKHQKAYDNWNNKLDLVAAYIKAGKTGRYETTTLSNITMLPINPLFKWGTIKLLRSLSNTSGLAFKKTLSLTDKSFTADGKCNSCGICARVCPVNNILIVDKKPVWHNHCESCLACLNWCPQSAIGGGISSRGGKIRRYRHPGVKLSDFLVREK